MPLDRYADMIAGSTPWPAAAQRPAGVAAPDPADPAPGRTPYVRQKGQNDCGLACLAMIAGHHGLAADLSVLRRLCTLPPKGATLRALIGTAARAGLAAQALKGGCRDLKHLALPVILHMNPDHFVVLTSARAGRFDIHDPATGPRALSEDELSACFTGAILELTPSVPGLLAPRSRRNLAHHSSSKGCSGASIPCSTPPRRHGENQ